MADDAPKPDAKRKPGPIEERLKFDMDWEEAADKIVKKKRPADGWPDDPKDLDDGQRSD